MQLHLAAITFSLVRQHAAGLIQYVADSADSHQHLRSLGNLPICFRLATHPEPAYLVLVVVAVGVEMLLVSMGLTSLFL